MTAPNRLHAGDTLDFTVSVPDYPPAAGWTLKLRLVARAQGGQTATITASAEGDLYRLQAGPSTTANWPAGAYGWHTWVEKVGARVTLEGTQYQGELTVLPDPSAIAAGTDTRSQARKALDDALAAQAAYVASKAVVAEYTIGERRMKFHSAGDLAALISRLRIDVAREQRAEAIAKGLADPRKVIVRAVRG